MTSDLLARAARIFGTGEYGDVLWPCGLAVPDHRLWRTNPTKYDTELAQQRAKQQSIVDWADGHGLRRSEAACCPLWLLRNGSRRCSRLGERISHQCTNYGTGLDRYWLDHSIGWVKNGKPAAITSAPYSVDLVDQERLTWWTAKHPLLLHALGEGWYGHDTTQVVLWRTDRIDRITPASVGREVGGQP
jgi:hypothetical protein